MRSPRGSRRSLGTIALLSLVGLSLAACKSAPPESDNTKPSSAAPTAAPAPSASATGASTAAPVATGIPLPPEQIAAQVNAGHRPAYSGPTGTVRGRISASGDQPPVLDAALKEIPDNCPQARETFGHVFREGMNRSLADVLVAVTGYEGYVPARGDIVTVEGRGCAWNTRTVALTFGQRIEVVSKDGAYVPDLLGQPAPAQLFANPTSPPVAMRPMKPGEYILVDSVRLFNAANVFVLSYATFDVTGLDGQYEIAGIPPGKVKLSAFLPITRGLVERELTVEAGKTLEVDLTIPFDKKAFEAQQAAKPAQPAKPAAPKTESPKAPKPN